MPQQPSAAPSAELADVNLKLNDLNRRLRAIEGSLEELKGQSALMGDTTASKLKEHETSIVASLRAISSIQKEIGAIKAEIGELKKDLIRAAPMNRLLELEGYINMIDPLKFVTRDEVKKLVRS